jgi:hypothetical protein
MRTPVPISVDGLDGLTREQVLPGRISLSDQGLLAELVVAMLPRVRLHSLCRTRLPA